MGLVIKKDSKWWYARYKVDGKEHYQNLQVEVRGKRPSTLKETGSPHFENSRGQAQEAFDRLMEDIHSGKSETQLAEAVYEARAGKKLKRYRIEDLSKIWIEKPRKRPPSKQHREQTVAKLNRVANYLKTNYPKLTRVDQLRPVHIQAYLDELEHSGVTAETWNKYLVVIKTVLKRAGVPAAKEIMSKDVETVFRKPYSIEELNAIFAAAQSDPLMHSLVVTAACTAMRRKDCCYLEWDAIDLDAGFITVKTSKTGQVVDIPMADMLRIEIEKQLKNDSHYVFPDAQLLYEANPTEITRRFKNILRLAGFDDGKDSLPVEYRTDPHTPAEILKAAEEIYSGKKLAHAQAVLSAYLAGNCIKDSAKAAGVSQGTASLYLNELEAHTHKAFIRGKPRVIKNAPPPSRGMLREMRENGKLAASVRDFHSFRTTFVTLALMRGMPIDTVRKITGHQTADVVTKHYFRPERDQLRKAIQKSLPGLLTSAGKPSTPAERAAEILRGINQKNWRKCADEALKVLEG